MERLISEGRANNRGKDLYPGKGLITWGRANIRGKGLQPEKKKHFKTSYVSVTIKISFAFTGF